MSPGGGDEEEGISFAIRSFLLVNWECRTISFKIHFQANSIPQNGDSITELEKLPRDKDGVGRLRKGAIKDKYVHM